MKYLYSKDNCPGCLQLKAEYNNKGITYEEVKIGRDITAQEFFDKFPGVRSVPYVVEVPDE